MPQFTMRALLSFVTLTAFCFAFYERLTIPGLLAGGLLILSATEVVSNARGAIAVQYLSIGYLFFLLELVLCIVDYSDMSQLPGKWSNFRHTVLPASLALRSSLSILTPILMAATVRVATTTNRGDRRPSRLLQSVLILTTANVVVLFFVLFAICWFGLR